MKMLRNDKTGSSSGSSSPPPTLQPLPPPPPPDQPVIIGPQNPFQQNPSAPGGGVIIGNIPPQIKTFFMYGFPAFYEAVERTYQDFTQNPPSSMQEPYWNYYQEFKHTWQNQAREDWGYPTKKAELENQFIYLDDRNKKQFASEILKNRIKVGMDSVHFIYPPSSSQ